MINVLIYRQKLRNNVKIVPYCLLIGDAKIALA